jgi:fructuronate reductase
LALTVAGWIASVAPPAGFDPGPHADEIREPARARLAEVTRGASGPRDHAMAVLRSGFMPDDLVAHEAFTDRLADLVAIIVRSGIRAAVQDAVQAVGHRRVS